MKLDIPLAITVPTPAAVNSEPNAVRSWGNILTGPTESIILAPSSKMNFGLAFVIIKVAIVAITAAIPIAAVPLIEVNCAIPRATIAITRGGKKTLFLSFSDWVLANSPSRGLVGSILTCLETVKQPKAIIKIPTILAGI